MSPPTLAGSQPLDLTKRVIPLATADNHIRELVPAPVSPDWTIDRLAEQVLCAIAARGSAEGTANSARAELPRSTSKAAYSGRSSLWLKTSRPPKQVHPHLDRGRLLFQRPSHDGPVWIHGQFENMPGTVRVTLRRSSSPPQHSEPSACEWSPPVSVLRGKRTQASSAQAGRREKNCGVLSLMRTPAVPPMGGSNCRLCRRGRGSPIRDPDMVWISLPSAVGKVGIGSKDYGLESAEPDLQSRFSGFRGGGFRI